MRWEESNWDTRNERKRMQHGKPAKQNLMLDELMKLLGVEQVIEALQETGGRNAQKVMIDYARERGTWLMDWMTSHKQRLL